MFKYGNIYIGNFQYIHVLNTVLMSSAWQRGALYEVPSGSEIQRLLSSLKAGSCMHEDMSK